MFLNNRDGQFVDVSAVSGFDLPDDGRGLAQVDWDNDGDLDFWFSNRNGPQVRFLENQQSSARHFLNVRLRGVQSNRDGIGTRVQVFTSPDAKPITRTLRAGDSFLSQSSKTLHFGLGDARGIDRIEVRWPSGQTQVFRGAEVNGAEVNTIIMLTEGKSEIESNAVITRPIPAKPSAETSTPLVAGQKTICFSMIGYPAKTYQDPRGLPQTYLQPGARMVLVNLWASWCAPCLEELANLTANADRLRQEKVDVVALSVDEVIEPPAGGDSVPQELLRRIGFPFRSGAADRSLVTKLQMLNDTTFEIRDPLPVPTSFLLDRKRRVLIIYKGPVTADELLSDIRRCRVKTTAEWRDVTVPFKGHWFMPPRSRHLFDFVNDLADRGFREDARDYVRQTPEMFTSHPRWNELRTKLSNP